MTDYVIPFFENGKEPTTPLADSNSPPPLPVILRISDRLSYLSFADNLQRPGRLFPTRI